MQASRYGLSNFRKNVIPRDRISSGVNKAAAVEVVSIILAPGELVLRGSNKHTDQFGDFLRVIALPL